MDGVVSESFTRATQIEDICFELMQQILRGLPTLIIKFDTASSSFQESEEYLTDTNDSKKSQTSIHFKRKASRNNFALTVTTLQRAHQMLLSGSGDKINIRSFSYELKPNFEDLSDDRVNRAITNVGKLLNCERWDIGFVTTSKGLVAGNIILNFQDRSIICDKLQGELIPQEMHSISSIEANADFVLVVEKDTVFQKLLQNKEKFLERNNGILITGKGEPDIATRMLVKYLSEKMEIPTFIVVDNNPHGFEIMCTYRFGSINHKHLAAPSARWLGFHPTETGSLSMKDKLMPLTENEKQKLKSIKNRKDLTLSKDLRKQLRKMKKTGKAELESIMSLGRCYFSESYVPNKISRREFY